MTHGIGGLHSQEIKQRTCFGKKATVKNDFIPALSTDWLTSFYDRVIESMGWGRALKRRVLQEVHLTAGERLLDIGCGTGTLLLEAVRETPGAHLTGIDPDPQILSLAQRKLQAYPMELVQASAEQLPFPPMSFDVVVSTLAFHHMPIESKRRAIAEIARGLTAGGRFLLADVGPATTLPFKVMTALLLSLATLVHLKEARSARENLQGVLPFLLKEADFTMREPVLRYRGIHLLLATKNRQ
jgi:ubiquinone/menaquinone biosynthesis C-methylase UbiE